MAGYIPRDVYLQKLIDSRLSGDVKVVTGPRRCGKSWLLTRLYKDYLIADGVPEEDIIIVSLDMDDENNQSELADKEKLKAYLYGKITDPKRTYYVMLDEIQEVDGFEKLVNGLRNKDNVDRQQCQVTVQGHQHHLPRPWPGDSLQSFFFQRILHWQDRTVQ